MGVKDLGWMKVIRKSNKHSPEDDFELYLGREWHLGRRKVRG